MRRLRTSSALSSTHARTARRFDVEALEPRLLLSADLLPFSVPADLALDTSAGGTLLRLVDRDSGHILSTHELAGEAEILIDLDELRGPDSSDRIEIDLTALSNAPESVRIEVMTGGGDDAVLVTGAGFGGSLIVDAGTGNDFLQVEDQSSGAVRHRSTGPMAGEIVADHHVIGHRNVETVTLVTTSDDPGGSLGNDANASLTTDGTGTYVLAVSYAFDATEPVSDLTGDTGFTLQGLGSSSALSLASGDLNADGTDDLVIGDADANMVYVLFGGAADFNAIDLTQLDGTNGFAISGEAGGDGLGASVAVAEDINNDQIDDLILGAPGAGGGAGRAYAIYGAANIGAGGTFELSSLDAASGFTVDGLASGDALGSAVAGTGDVNTDLIGDIVLGAPGAGAGAGAAYVVFGGHGAASVDLSALDGDNGFTVTGSAGDALGTAVTGISDLNGDGQEDLAIGAPGASPNGAGSGQVTVIFGYQVFDAALTPSDMDGDIGFRINGANAGDAFGTVLADAGDLNNDGQNDLALGAPSAEGHQVVVLFGVYATVQGFFDADVDVGSLAADQALVFSDVWVTDDLGASLAGSGDINGDGIGDLVVGSPGFGEIYVILGDHGLTGQGLTPDDFDGILGFVLQSGSPDGTFGQAVTLGDVNGDGITDLVAAAPGDGTLFGLYGRTDGGSATTYNFGTGPGSDFTVEGQSVGAKLTLGSDTQEVTSIATGGGDLKILLADGDSFTSQVAVTGGSSITVADGAIVDTRGPSGDGDITLNAATITVGAGAQLLAADEGEDGGTIELQAVDHVSLSNFSFAQVEDALKENYTGRTATVTVEDGALIRGGKIDITADAGDLSFLKAALQALSGGNVFAVLDTLASIFAFPIAFAHKKSTAEVTIGSADGAAVTIDGYDDVNLGATATSTASASATYYQNSEAAVAFTISVLIAEADAKVTVDGGDADANTVITSRTGDVTIASDVTTYAGGYSTIQQNMGTNPYTGAEFPSNPNNVSFAVAVDVTNATGHTTVEEYVTLNAVTGDVVVRAHGDDGVNSELGGVSYTDGKSSISTSVVYSTPDIQTVVKGTIVSGATEQIQTDLGFDPFGSVGGELVVDYDADTILLGQNLSLETGQRVVYYPGDGGWPIDGLVSGDVYWIIDAGGGKVQLAASLEDAGSGVAVDLLPQPTLSLADGTILPFSLVLGNTEQDVPGTSNQISFGYDHGVTNGETVTYHAVEGKAIEGIEDGASYTAVVGSDPTRLQLADSIGVVPLSTRPWFEVISVGPDSIAEVGERLDVQLIDDQTKTVQFDEVHGLSPGDEIAYHGALGVTLLDDQGARVAEGQTFFAIPTFSGAAYSNELDPSAIRLATTQAAAEASDGFTGSLNFGIDSRVARGDDHSLTRSGSGVTVEATLDSNYKVYQLSQIGGDPGFGAKYANPIFAKASFASYADPYQIFGDAGKSDAVAPAANDEMADDANAQTSKDNLKDSVAIGVAIVDSTATAVLASTADITAGTDVTVHTESKIHRRFHIEGATSANTTSGQQGESTFDIAGAIAIAVVDTTSRAVVNGGAQIDAGGTIEVSSEVLYPFEAAVDSWKHFGEFVLNDFIANPDVLLGSLIDPLALISDFFVGHFTTSRAQLPQSEYAFGVTVQFASYNTISEAIVAEGALLNQRDDPSGGTDARAVTVKSDVFMPHISIGGVMHFSLSLLEIPSLIGRETVPTGTEGQKGAMGVALSWFDFDNKVSAEVNVASPVDDNGDVTTTVATASGPTRIHTGTAGDGLLVEASDDTWFINLVGSGAGTSGETSSGTVAFAGSGSIFRYNHNGGGVTARIQSGAELTGGSVKVTATTNSLFVGANGDVVRGINSGVGVSINYWEINRNTTAYIGDANGQSGVSPDELAKVSVLLDPGSTVTVTAANSGAIFGLALASEDRTEVPEAQNSDDERTDAPDAGASDTGAEDPADAVNPDGSGQQIVNDASEGVSFVEDTAGQLIGDDEEAAPAAVGDGDAAEPATGGISVNAAGDATVIKFTGDSALAFVWDPGEIQAASLDVAAQNGTVMGAFSGALARSTNDSSSPTNLGLAGSFSSFMLENGATAAFVRDLETLDLQGGLTIDAYRSTAFNAFAAGGAGGMRDSEGAEVAGSAAYNSLRYDVDAYLQGVGNVTLGDDSTIKAHEKVLTTAMAGGITSNGTLGFASAWAWNQIDRQISASIIETTVTQNGGDLTVSALLNDGIEPPFPTIMAAAATVGKGDKQTEFEFTGTVAVNEVNTRLDADANATLVQITQSSITNEAADGDLTLTAEDKVRALAISGNVSLGAASTIGAAASVNRLVENVEASIEDSMVELKGATGDLTVSAELRPEIDAMALGVVTSDVAQLAGSGVANSVTFGVDAHLSNSGSSAVTISARDIRVSADLVILDLLAGAGEFGLQHSKNTSGIAIGASVAINVVTSTVEAYVSGLLAVTASGDVTIVASSDMTGLMLAVAVGAIFGDGAAIAGSMSGNFVTSTVTTTVESGAQITATGTLSVLAVEKNWNVSSGGGVVDVSTEKSSIAVGAALGINDYTSTVNAIVTGGSALTSSGDDVQIIAERREITVVAVGVAGTLAGSFSLVGSAGVNILDFTTEAWLTGNSSINAKEVGWVVAKDDLITVAGTAGTIALSQSGLAVGAAVGVNLFRNHTIRAGVGNRSEDALKSDGADGSSIKARALQIDAGRSQTMNIALGVSGAGSEKSSAITGSAAANSLSPIVGAYAYGATLTGDEAVVIEATDTTGTNLAVAGAASLSLSFNSAGADQSEDPPEDQVTENVFNDEASPAVEQPDEPNSPSADEDADPPPDVVDPSDNNGVDGQIVDTAGMDPDGENGQAGPEAEVEEGVQGVVDTLGQKIADGAVPEASEILDEGPNFLIDTGGILAPVAAPMAEDLAPAAAEDVTEAAEEDVEGSNSIGVGVALSFNVVTNATVEAIAYNSDLTADDGFVRVAATQVGLGVTVAGSGGAAGNVVLIAVAVADYTGQTTQAVVDNVIAGGQDVSAGGDVFVTATARMNLVTVGGTAGFAKDGSSAAVSSATTIHSDTVLASIRAIDVSALGTAPGSDNTPVGVAVTATSADTVTTVAAGVVANTGSGTAAITGSLSLNFLDETTQASIDGDANTINADNSGAAPAQNVAVTADGHVTLHGGGGAFGINTGGTTGFGGGADAHEHSTTTEAWIVSKEVNAANNVIVEATSRHQATSYEGSVELGSGTEIAGALGAIIFDTTTRAYIGRAATANPTVVTAQGSVLVNADEKTEADVFSGVLDVSSSKAAVGGTLGIVVLRGTTEAYIDANATVTGYGRNGTDAIDAASGAYEITYVDPSGDDTEVQPPGVTIHNPTGVGTVDQDPALTKTRQADVATESMTGIAVTANRSNVIRSVAGAGGLATGIAFELAAAMDFVLPEVNAYIAGTAIAGDSSDANAPVAHVRVNASHDHHQLMVVGAVAISTEQGGSSPAANWTKFQLTTSATIEDGATVRATGDVAVLAAASEHMTMVAIALGAGSEAAFSASAIIITSDNTTTAEIGAATVTAGGNVLVAASDDTSIFGAAGSVSLSFSNLAVGAGVLIADINKTTEALIDTGAIVDATGAGESYMDVVVGETSENDFNTKKIVGVAVQASTSEDVTLVAAAASGTLDGGALAGGVTYVHVDSDTTAAIDVSAEVNQNTTTANSGQSVAVGATNDVTVNDFAGALSIGFAGLAGGVDVGVVRNGTEAYIGSGAKVSAAEDVDVVAASIQDVHAIAVSAAATIGGITGSISVWTIGQKGVDSSYGFQSTDSDPGGSTSSDDALKSRTNNGHTGTDDSSGYQQHVQSETERTDVTNVLGSYQQGPASPEFEAPDSTTYSLLTILGGAGGVIGTIEGNPLVTTIATAFAEESSYPGGSLAAGTRAYIEDGATIDAGDDVNVVAVQDTRASITTGGLGGGGAAIGASIGIVNIDGPTSASLDGTITAGDDITVSATYTGSFDNTAVVGEAGGLAALGAAVAIVNDTASQYAMVADGAAILNAADVSVTASRDYGRFTVGAVEIAASLGAAGGVSVSIAEVTGETQALVGDADIGGSNRYAPTVGTLAIKATSTASPRLTGFALSGGPGLAGAGGNQIATITPTVEALLGSGNADFTINTRGDVTLDAVSNARPSIKSEGFDFGGVSIGVVIATATAAPKVTARIAGTADVNVNVKQDGSKTDQTGIVRIFAASGDDPDVFAETTGGSIAGGSGTISTTNVAPVINAFVDDGATVAAQADVLITAESEYVGSSNVEGQNYGGVQIGVANAFMNINPTVKAYIQSATKVTSVTSNAGAVEVLAEAGDPGAFQTLRFDPTKVDYDNNIITFDLPHGLVSGDVIAYQPGENAPEIGGLTAGQTYQVIRVSDLKIKLGTLFSADDVDNERGLIAFDRPSGLSGGQQVIYDDGGGEPIQGLTDGGSYFVNTLDTFDVKLADTLAVGDGSEEATFDFGDVYTETNEILLDLSQNVATDSSGNWRRIGVSGNGPGYFFMNDTSADWVTGDPFIVTSVSGNSPYELNGTYYMVLDSSYADGNEYAYLYWLAETRADAYAGNYIKTSAQVDLTVQPLDKSQYYIRGAGLNFSQVDLVVQTGIQALVAQNYTDPDEFPFKTGDVVTWQPVDGEFTLSGNVVYHIDVSVGKSGDDYLYFLYFALTANDLANEKFVDIGSPGIGAFSISPAVPIESGDALTYRAPLAIEASGQTQVGDLYTIEDYIYQSDVYPQDQAVVQVPDGDAIIALQGDAQAALTLTTDGPLSFTDIRVSEEQGLFALWQHHSDYLQLADGFDLTEPNPLFWSDATWIASETAYPDTQNDAGLKTLIARDVDTLHVRSGAESLIGDVTFSAFQFYGYLKVDNPGTHHFWLSVDNGAELRIAGKNVVSATNDTGTQSGSYDFTEAGYYAIQISWYENTVATIFTLESDLTGTREVIPAELLRLPAMPVYEVESNTSEIIAIPQLQPGQQTQATFWISQVNYSDQGMQLPTQSLANTEPSSASSVTRQIFRFPGHDPISGLIDEGTYYITHDPSRPGLVKLSATAEDALNGVEINLNPFATLHALTGNGTGIIEGTGTDSGGDYIVLNASSTLADGDSVQYTAAVNRNISGIASGGIYKLAAAEAAGTFYLANANGTLAELGVSSYLATADGIGNFVDTGYAPSASGDGVNVAWGDVNGDGFDDLFAARVNGASTLSLSDGTGGFTLSSGLPAISGNVIAAEFADMDGDKDLDLVILRNGSAGAVYLNGEGTANPGEFTLASQFGSGGWQSATAMAVGDVDQDGTPDVVVTTISGARLYLNGGDGTLTDAGVTLGAAADYQRDVALADLDFDGDLDMFIANFDTGSRLFINQGGVQGGTVGTFADAGVVIGDGGTLAVALGDIDGDGADDAITVEASDASTTIWSLNGFVNGVPRFVSLEAPLVPSGGEQSGTSTAAGVVIGDVNGDGNLDVVVARNSGTAGVSLFLNQGLGTFDRTAAVTIGDTTAPWRAAAFGDPDGDGDLDLGLSNAQFHERVFLNASIAYEIQTDDANETITFLGDQPSLAAGDALTFVQGYGVGSDASKRYVGLEDGQVYYAILPDLGVVSGGPVIRLAETESAARNSVTTKLQTADEAGYVYSSGMVRFHVGTVTPLGTHYLGIEGIGIKQPPAPDIETAATIDTANLGKDGITIEGAGGGGTSGTSAAGVGDVDGDGKDDLLIGGVFPAAVLDIPGQGDATVDLAALTGANGVRILDGSVAGGILDINFDGFGDLVIGDPDADLGNLSDAGRVYVIFGTESGFDPTLDPTTLNGANGFIIDGLAAGDRLGSTLAHAGDFNDDGIADLAIGAEGSETVAYIVYGSADFGVGDGLNGLHYTQVETVTTLEMAEEVVVYTEPTATFVSSTIDYPNSPMASISDGVSLSTFLGDDGATIEGENSKSLSNTVTLFVGKLLVDFAATYEFTVETDDGFNLSIDGTTVASFAETGVRTVTGSIHLDAGLHDFQLLRYENEGGTQIHITSTLSQSVTQLLETERLFTVDENGIANKARFDLSALDGTNGFAITLGAATSASYAPEALAAGLVGEVFAIDGISTIDAALAAMRGGEADATFVATALDYPGGSPLVADAGTTLGEFLGTDADSIDGDETLPVAASVFRFAGRIQVDEAGTYSFEAAADGGFRLMVGGKTVLEKNETGFTAGVTGRATFNAPGYYAFELVYFSDGGPSGLELRSDLGGALAVLGGQTLRAPLDISAAVAGAGDVNDDGLDDLIVGVSSMNQAYIVLGSDDAVASTINLSALDGSNGTLLTGADGSMFGAAVAGAGDVNDDGRADVIVGAPGADADDKIGVGQAFVLFGKDGGFGASIDMTTLPTSGGFHVNGIAAGDGLGASVAGIGDINDDGIDDFALGAPSADRGGKVDVGEAYVIHGAAQIVGVEGALRVSTLDGANGLTILGTASGDLFGTVIGPAGDVNADGGADIFATAPGASPSGRAGAGATYVIYGAFTPTHAFIVDLTENSEAKTEQGFSSLGGSDGLDTLSGKPTATASGTNGDLVGVEATLVKVTATPSVTATIGDTTNFANPTLANVTGEDVFVIARDYLDVTATSSGFVITLLAGGGAATVEVDATHDAGARIGGGAKLEATDGKVQLASYVSDQIDATAGTKSGGLVSAPSATADITIERANASSVREGATVIGADQILITANSETNATAGATAHLGASVDGGAQSTARVKIVPAGSNAESYTEAEVAGGNTSTTRLVAPVIQLSSANYIDPDKKMVALSSASSRGLGAKTTDSAVAETNIADIAGIAVEGDATILDGTAAAPILQAVFGYQDVHSSAVSEARALSATALSTATTTIANAGARLTKVGTPQIQLNGQAKQPSAQAMLMPGQIGAYAHDTAYVLWFVKKEDSGTTSSADHSITVNDFGTGTEADLLGDGTPEAYEGDLLTIRGTVSGSAFFSGFEIEIDWGDPHSDDNQVVLDFGPGNTGFQLDHTFIENSQPPGTGTTPVAITLRTPDGAAVDLSTEVRILNADPVITSISPDGTAPWNVVPGETVTIEGTFTDAGILDTHIATVDWGDGLIETIELVQQPGSGTFVGTHVYTTSGTFAVIVTVRDDDGGSDQRRATALVDSVVLVDGVLHVAGTGGDDLVRISATGNGKILLNTSLPGGRWSFDADDVERIEITGGAGNDEIRISGALSQEIVIDAGAGDDLVSTTQSGAIIYGGDGDDWLRGSNESDLIFGGDGNDTILARGGDDQVFGGAGDDTIRGGAGDDDLFGGDGDDLIFGDAGDDMLAGQGHDDILRGGAGADELTGGPGDDALYGGSGPDIANFSGSEDSFRIQRDRQAVIVTDLAGNEGRNTLFDIEEISFDTPDMPALAALSDGKADALRTDAGRFAAFARRAAAGAAANVHK